MDQKDFTQARWRELVRDQVRPLLEKNRSGSDGGSGARLQALDRLLDDPWLRNRWPRMAKDVRKGVPWTMPHQRLVKEAIAPPEPLRPPDLAAACKAMRAFRTLAKLCDDDQGQLLEQIRICAFIKWNDGDL